MFTVETSQLLEKLLPCFTYTEHPMLIIMECPNSPFFYSKTNQQCKTYKLRREMKNTSN